MKCQDCKFYEIPDVDDGDNPGHCHRYPPTIIKGEKREYPNALIDFPEVSYNDWCGEFQSGKTVWNEDKLEFVAQ